MGVEDDKQFVKSLRLATWKVDFVNSGGDSSVPFTPDFKDRERAPFDEANAYSSVRWFAKDGATEREAHTVLVDIDSTKVRLIPSSTPGHFHLVLDTSARWDDYVALLRLLKKMGVVEEGFVELTIARKQAFLRMPGETKQGGRLVDLSDDVMLDNDFVSPSEIDPDFNPWDGA